MRGAEHISMKNLQKTKDKFKKVAPSDHAIDANQLNTSIRSIKIRKMKKNYLGHKIMGNLTKITV